jgi:hypothetical protein
MIRSDFTATRVDGVIVVIDENIGGTSVTNDIENVVAYIFTNCGFGDCPLVYRDSEGRWDGVTVKDGRFVGFRYVGALDAPEAIRKAKELRRRGDL